MPVIFPKDGSDVLTRKFEKETVMSNGTTKPIKKLSIGNGITASIWENSTENGVLHTVEVERRYKEKNSDNWKTSTNYIGSQVLLVSKAYELAFEYIVNLKNTSSD